MSSREHGSRWVAAAYPLAFVGIAVATVCWLLVTGTDISVWQDFRRDALIRDSFRPDEISDVRFYDSSPYTIWLASDLFVWRSIRSGTLPLWDPSQAGGYSPLLNIQNGVMHPVRWMMAAVPFENVPSVLIVTELLLLALGTYLMLGRLLDLSPEAAASGAVVLALGGYSMSVIQFSGAMLPLVHVPWIVWAWRGYVQNRVHRYALAMIALVALLLVSGHPLLIATSVVAASIPIAWFALAERRPRDLAFAALFGLAAVPLAAFAILPAAFGAQASWSYKLGSSHGTAFRAVGSGEFWDALMATVLYQREAWDKLDGGSITFYFGPIVVLLGCIGLARAGRSRGTAVVAALLVVGLLLSTPSDGLALLAEMTPLRFFKPWYLMFLFALGGALAAALGVETLLARLRGVSRNLSAFVLLVIILLSLRPAVRDGLAASRMRKVSNPILDLLHNEREPFRVVGLRGQTLLPNSGAITGVEDIRFSSPVLPARYREWFRCAAPRAVQGSFPTTILPDEVESPMYGAFNVKYVLRSRPVVHDVHTFLPRPGVKPPASFTADAIPDPEMHPVVLEMPSVTLFENRLDYHPRAHFAKDAVVVKPGIGAAIRAMNEPSKFGVEVIESADSLPPQVLAAMTEHSPGDSVTIRYTSSRTLEIVTRSRSHRILVLHDSWDPGWSARLDGVSLDVMPVSLISRGIMVPAGEHRIEMSFLPKGFVGGLFASTLASLAILLVVLRSFRVPREVTA